MWQTKGLREGVLGSVAMIGLRTRFSVSVAGKGFRKRVVRGEWPLAKTARGKGVGREEEAAWGSRAEAKSRIHDPR